MDSNEGIELKGEGFNIFPYYDRNAPVPNHDIALVKLESKVKISNDTNVIPIEGTFIQDPGTNVRISGRGIQINGTRSTRNLYTMMIKINDPMKCYLWDSYDKICAGNQDACPGDSGGPLVYEDGDYKSLLGVVSYGPQVKCGSKDGFGVYQRILPYINWIKHQVSDNIITNQCYRNYLSMYFIILILVIQINLLKIYFFPTTFKIALAAISISCFDVNLPVDSLNVPVALSIGTFISSKTFEIFT